MGQRTWGRPVVNMNRLVILSIAVLCLCLGAKASGDDHDEHDHDEEHGHGTIYSKGWMAHFGYAIQQKGEHIVSMMGRTCKNSHLNLVLLKAEDHMNGHLEDNAQAYFNHTYPFNIAPNYAGCTYKSWGDISGGTCPRVIVQQNESMSHPQVKYAAVALPTDETLSATVPFFQLQFNTTASEECTNSAGVVADAHAGHNHRRSGDDHEHEHGSGKMEMVIEFPEFYSDGVTAVPYPSNWYFFTDQNLTYWEFEIKLEGADEHLPLLSSEVSADPNACTAAAAAEEEGCNCQHSWLGGDDCEDEKYFWSGMIFLVGLIGLIPLIWKSLAENENMMILLGLLNCLEVVLCLQSPLRMCSLRPSTCIPPQTAMTTLQRPCSAQLDIGVYYLSTKCSCRSVCLVSLLLLMSLLPKSRWILLQVVAQVTDSESNRRQRRQLLPTITTAVGWTKSSRPAICCRLLEFSWQCLFTPSLLASRSASSATRMAWRTWQLPLSATRCSTCLLLALFLFAQTRNSTRLSHCASSWLS